MPSQIRCTTPEVELVLRERRKAQEVSSDKAVQSSRLQRTLQCVIYDGARRVDTCDIDLSNAHGDFSQLATTILSKVLSDEWNTYSEDETKPSDLDDLDSLDSVLGSSINFGNYEDDFEDCYDAPELPKAVENVVFVVGHEAFNANPDQEDDIRKAYPEIFDTGRGRIERTLETPVKQNLAVDQQSPPRVSIAEQGTSPQSLHQSTPLQREQLPTPTTTDSVPYRGSKQLEVKVGQVLDITDNKNTYGSPGTCHHEHWTYPSDLEPKSLNTSTTLASQTTVNSNYSMVSPLSSIEEAAEENDDSTSQGLHGPVSSSSVQTIAKGVDLKMGQLDVIQSMYDHWMSTHIVRVFNKKTMQLTDYYSNLMKLSIVGHRTGDQELQEHCQRRWQETNYAFPDPSDFPSINLVITAFRYLPPEAVLRRWIAITFAYLWSTCAFGEYDDFQSTLPDLDTESIAAFLYAIARIRCPITEGLDVKVLQSWCEFEDPNHHWILHHHNTDQERKRCQKHRDKISGNKLAVGQATMAAMKLDAAQDLIASQDRENKMHQKRGLRSTPAKRKTNGSAESIFKKAKKNGHSASPGLGRF